MSAPQRRHDDEVTAFLSYPDMSNAFDLEISEGGRPGR